MKEDFETYLLNKNFLSCQREGQTFQETQKCNNELRKRRTALALFSLRFALLSVFSILTFFSQ